MKILTPVLSALLVVSFSLTARSQEIEVDPGDSKITIKGFTGDDASFNGDVRVTLRNANQATPKLLLLPSHLQRTDGGAQINRGQVQVGEGVTLSPDVPTTIPIKVTGVKAPGEYKGKLELLLAGQARDTAKTVELIVLANVRTTLTALANADRLKTNLVNCDPPCWLATWLLPGSTQKDYEIKFEKPIGASQPVLEITTDVKGEQNGFQWKSTHFGFGQPIDAASSAPPSNGQAGSTNNPADKRFLVFPVTLSHADLPADHYTGSIYLSLDADTPVIKLPVDVNVRVAPLWPLLFLFIGILLGKLIKYMQEKGGPKADALVVFNRVEARYRKLVPADQKLIESQLDNARRLINEDSPAEAVTLSKSIDARITALESLREIEARLAGKEQHPKVKEVLGQLNEAREFIRGGQDSEMNVLMNDIRKTLVSLSTTLMGDENVPDPAVKEAAEAAKNATIAGPVTAGTITPAKIPLHKRVTRFLADFSGVVDDLEPETARWVLQPLLWLVLVLGLVALGLKSLYIDNPTFGANAADYVSLIFWGMSSDVASRALGSLKFG